MTDTNIHDLAKELDGEDMIGFTRSFVGDIRSGLEEISSPRYDWIEDLAKQEWSEYLLLEWAVQRLVAISLLLYVVFMAKFQLLSREITLSLHGGTNLG